VSSVATDAVSRSGGAGSRRHAEFMRAKRLRRLWLVGTQLLVLVIFLGGWHLAAALKWVDPFIISQPGAIANKLAEMAGDGSLFEHTGVTLVETLISFAIGTVAGVVFAGAFWWWRFLSDVADPYIVILNATPKIALGPVFIIWLGANTNSVIALAVSITLFVAILSVYGAFRQTDPQKLLLVKVLGGSKWQQFSKVVLPAAVPTIISTMKVNIGLALTGTIVGEFLSAQSGLGYLIIYGQNIFNMTLVMVSLAILAAIATVMYLAVWVLERRYEFRAA
jgi:NitT/TauT family transport system permease protein